MVESDKTSVEELKKRVRKRSRGKKNEQQKAEEDSHSVEENADEKQKKSEKKVKNVKLQGRGKIEEEEEEEVEAMEDGEEEKNPVIVGKGIMTDQTFDSLDLSEQTSIAIKEMGFQYMTHVRKFEPSSDVKTGFCKTWSCDLWQSMFLSLLIICYHSDSSWIDSAPFGGEGCSWCCQDWFW